jgi:hypothetical protein
MESAAKRRQKIALTDGAITSRHFRTVIKATFDLLRWGAGAGNRFSITIIHLNPKNGQVFPRSRLLPRTEITWYTHAIVWCERERGRNRHISADMRKLSVFARISKFLSKFDNPRAFVKFVSKKSPQILG